MQIAVVDASTGKACTFGRSFVRNLFLGFGLLDWTFLLGKKQQRLGDMAANTLVVQRCHAVGSDHSGRA
jgi:hypothetical protein